MDTRRKINTKDKKPETVKENWEMECPKCESDESIEITASQIVIVTLCVDGTDSDDGGDIEWKDDSAARCCECDFHGTVKDFKVKEQNNG